MTSQAMKEFNIFKKPNLQFENKSAAVLYVTPHFIKIYNRAMLFNKNNPHLSHSDICALAQIEWTVFQSCFEHYCPSIIKSQKSPVKQSKKSKK